MTRTRPQPLERDLIIAKKPGQSVEKRRRERERHLKREEKAERKRVRKEEMERKKLSGEAIWETDNPFDEPVEGAPPES